MSPCSPESTTISIPSGPSVTFPGFNIPATSPIQLPISGVALPNIGSVLDLINQFTAQMPSGAFKPNLDDLSNSVLTALMSLFNQLAPFLSIYNFFQPVLNMIMCLVDLACSIPNPFKMYKA